MVYPNAKHHNYSDCDDEFLGTVTPYGMKAIGHIIDYRNATNSFILNEVPSNYEELFDGTEKSTCALPCSIYKFESRFTEQITRMTHTLKCLFQKVCS